ncbi:hypothetical protein BDY21DRAFT_364191 [Lineolata rhizophorae]|uniref:Uncharacterized protein n=1 Tax=Lineolata rhizophorae TaxID=578093 RepID=A0A6A6P022_9PEZI|nr:hypothetical protein BDY21DRAFT_364191 [Lineolata rhizophorae]
MTSGAAALQPAPTTTVQPAYQEDQYRAQGLQTIYGTAHTFFDTGAQDQQRVFDFGFLYGPYQFAMNPSGQAYGYGGAGPFGQAQGQPTVGADNGAPAGATLPTGNAPPAGAAPPVGAAPSGGAGPSAKGNEPQREQPEVYEAEYVQARPEMFPVLPTDVKDMSRLPPDGTWVPWEDHPNPEAGFREAEQLLRGDELFPAADKQWAEDRLAEIYYEVLIAPFDTRQVGDFTPGATHRAWHFFGEHGRPAEITLLDALRASREFKERAGNTIMSLWMYYGAALGE